MCLFFSGEKLINIFLLKLYLFLFFYVWNQAERKVLAGEFFFSCVKISQFFSHLWKRGLNKNIKNPLAFTHMNLKKKKSIKKCSPEVKTKLSKCEIQWRENIFTGEKGGVFFFLKQ